jgi:2-polyprenyl-3-methyl-5-hydroxy-6-metoxy-1,4-benzoquinol methylase
MIFKENLQYQPQNYQYFEQLPAEWKAILSWVGWNKRVLEIGCHTGDLSKWMQKQECKITGVELNGLALEKAKPFLEGSILNDIELNSIWNLLGEKKFDVILFGHVLEHLQDPWSVLHKARNVLSENGIIIIALPNISNADSRFKILFGRFNYEEIGVMDRTHLRFFNIQTANELIEKSGFHVEEYFAPVQVNPVREFIDHLPILTYLRNLFPAKPTRFPKFSSNLTDMVMLFKCRLK